MGCSVSDWIMQNARCALKKQIRKLICDHPGSEVCEASLDCWTGPSSRWGTSWPLGTSRTGCRDAVSPSSSQKETRGPTELSSNLHILVVFNVVVEMNLICDCEICIGNPWLYDSPFTNQTQSCHLVPCFLNLTHRALRKRSAKEMQWSKRILREDPRIHLQERQRYHPRYPSSCCWERLGLKIWPQDPVDFLDYVHVSNYYSMDLNGWTCNFLKPVLSEA